VEEAARAYARAYLRKHGAPPTTAHPDGEGDAVDQTEPDELPASDDGGAEEQEEAMVLYSKHAQVKAAGAGKRGIGKAAARRALQGAYMDEDTDEEEVAAASSRPAKRARVATLATLEERGAAALALPLPPRQRGLDIQVGEGLEVEWNGSYYPATVVAITMDGLLNVK
jgi:hypothetical protein